MRRGVFEEHEGDGGERVFRLRWLEESDLTPEEVARGRFIQYLIQRGRLSENHVQPPGR